MGGATVNRFQDVFVKVPATEIDERVLDEVEQYNRWLDLAAELSAREAKWLQMLN